MSLTGKCIKSIVNRSSSLSSSLLLGSINIRRLHFTATKLPAQKKGLLFASKYALPIRSFSVLDELKGSTIGIEFSKQASLANDYYSKADFDNAVKIYEEIVEKLIERVALSKDEKLPVIICDAIKFMWSRYAECALRLSKANELINVSNKLLNSIKDREAEILAITYSGMGDAYFSLFHVEEAEKYYRKALVVLESNPDLQTRDYLIFNIYNGISKAADAKGERAKAKEMYQKVLELAFKLGNPALIAHSKTSLGTSHARDGEVDKAHQLLTEGLDEIRKDTSKMDPTELFRSVTALAAVKEAKQEVHEALKLALEGVEIVKKLGNKQLLASALLTSSSMRLRVGAFEEAKKEFFESRELLKTIQNSGMKDQLSMLSDQLYNQVFSKI